MMKVLSVIISIICVNYVYGELDNTGDRYYFKDLFSSHVNSQQQAEAILSKPKPGKKEFIECGIFYFIVGSNLKASPDIKEKYSKKSLEVFNDLWRNNKKDNRIKMLLAYSHAICAGLKNQSFDELMAHVFKARNYFSMIVADMPDNIDARLGRTRINMNMPAGNGRPDDLILDDCNKYFEVYDRFSKDMQEDILYKTGLHEFYLACSMVQDAKGNGEEAKKYLKLIDKAYLNEVIAPFYVSLKKRYGL